MNTVPQGTWAETRAGLDKRVGDVCLASARPASYITSYHMPVPSLRGPSDIRTEMVRKGQIVVTFLLPWPAGSSIQAFGPRPGYPIYLVPVGGCVEVMAGRIPSIPGRW